MGHVVGTGGSPRRLATGVVVAFVCAVIAWFAIMFTGRHPDGLWGLAAFYIRWRVRAGSYVALLRDEYPPFGDGDYPVAVYVERPQAVASARLSAPRLAAKGSASL